MELIDKSAVVAEIERRLKVLNKSRDFNYLQIKELESLFAFLDTLDVKEDKEMPTSGECVTISKERYQELLDYESIALWAINLIIVASLPSIDNEKLKEMSNNAKYKAVQAAFQEALKNKEDKK